MPVNESSWKVSQLHEAKMLFEVVGVRQKARNRIVGNVLNKLWRHGGSAERGEFALLVLCNIYNI